MRHFFWNIAFSLFAVSLFAEPLQFEINGETAILMNADTGVILFEKEPHRLIFPASTTKIASTLYALKVKGHQLDEIIAAEQESLGSVTQEAKRKSGHKLPPYWLEPDGTHIGIKKGEELSIRDLIAACLIPSANDAANVLAQGIGKTIPLYVDLVNGYLKGIGCLNTHLLNPHGLHHPEHQSTAHDLALMAKEGLKNPLFRELIMMPRFIRPKTNMQSSSTYLHTNQLIRSGKHHYPKAIGVKTGYHAKAKSVIVAAAKSDNRTLIAVLVGYSERKQMFQDAKKLFETAFNQPKLRRIYLKAGHQTFTKEIAQGNRPLLTYLPSNLSLEYYPAEDPQAKCQLIWRALSLPVRKNQVVADLQLVSKEGQILTKAPLLAEEKVALSWPYNWAKAIANFLQNSPILSILFLSLIFISLIISVWMIFAKPKGEKL